MQQYQVYCANPLRTISLKESRNLLAQHDEGFGANMTSRKNLKLNFILVESHLRDVADSKTLILSFASRKKLKMG